MAQRTRAVRANPLLVGAVRRVGWLIAAVGAVLLVLGWYGVSGQADVAEQLPYLASASLPGAALVVGGLALAGAERVRGRAAVRAAVEAQTDRRVAELHGLLVEPAGADGEPAAADGGPAVPDGEPEVADGEAAQAQPDPGGQPAEPDPGGQPAEPDQRGR